MKNLQQNKLIRIVHIDKFVIEVSEESKKRRNKGLNKLIVLAIEVLKNRAGIAYA